MYRTCAGLLLAIIVSHLLGSDRAAASVQDSVVRIEVTSRSPDMYRPWSKKSPSKSSGSGVMIAGNRILTNAHVVRFASQIQVQQYGASDQHSAQVVAIAPDIDLALLELEEAEVADTIPPLEIEDSLPKPRQKVTAYGYPVGGEELSITEGVVSRIEFSSFYFERYGLRIQIDAALNPGNSGGPAVSDSKLVGLVFSKIKEADNIGYLIPVEEINDFLTDVEDGNYESKPKLLESFSTTENLALRDWLKLDKATTGLTLQNAPEEDSVLKQWDVVTHIGEHNIDNQGFVRLNGDLRLRFNYFVPRLESNGTTPLTVFRNGESIQVDAPVHRDSDLVVPSLQYGYPEYFIWGPAVFTAATQEVVLKPGPRMWALFLASKSPLMGRLRDTRDFPGEEIVVIPNRLFPHRVTRGYGSAAMAVVNSIDGTPVKSLRHLVELLRDAPGDFVRIELAGSYETLVFRRSEAAAATEDILSDEGIRRQGSAELLKVWEASTPEVDSPDVESPAATTDEATVQAAG